MWNRKTLEMGCMKGYNFFKVQMRNEKVKNMLIIKVEELKSERRMLRIREVLPWKTFEFRGEPHKVLQPVTVDISARREGKNIIVKGDSSTVLEARCDRCLTRLELPLKGKIEAIYKRYDPDKKPIVESGELKDYENVIYYSEDEIDLTDRVEESLLLEIPMKILCKEDCKGICPHCGINLNEHPEHVCMKTSRVRTNKSRFSILKTLEL